MPSFLCRAASVGALKDNLALALRRSETNEGLTLETSASESLYGSHQFTLSTQIKTKLYLVLGVWDDLETVDEEPLRGNATANYIIELLLLL